MSQKQKHRPTFAQHPTHHLIHVCTIPRQQNQPTPTKPALPSPQPTRFTRDHSIHRDSTSDTHPNSLLGPRLVIPDVDLISLPIPSAPSSIHLTMTPVNRSRSPHLSHPSRPSPIPSRTAVATLPRFPDHSKGRKNTKGSTRNWIGDN
jgi:hypothetical protein